MSQDDDKVVSFRDRARALRQKRDPDNPAYQRGFEVGVRWAEPLVFQMASEAPTQEPWEDPQYNLGVLFGIACALRNCADEITDGRG
jgi:hypothetical protein